MGRRGDGETRRWGDEEMERWRDGEMGRWGDWNADETDSTYRNADDGGFFFTTKTQRTHKEHQVF